VLYSIQLQGNTLADPYLRLYGSSGGPSLAQNNDFDGLNSHLTFRPDTSGVYYIAAAANHDSALGSYTMSIAAATIAPDLQVALTAISASTMPTRGDLVLNFTYANSGTERCGRRIQKGSLRQRCQSAIRAHNGTSGAPAISMETAELISCGRIPQVELSPGA
jgi:hypothetical protein